MSGPKHWRFWPVVDWLFSTYTTLHIRTLFSARQRAYCSLLVCQCVLCVYVQSVSKLSYLCMMAIKINNQFGPIRVCMFHKFYMYTMRINSTAAAAVSSVHTLCAVCVYVTVLPLQLLHNGSPQRACLQLLLAYTACKPCVTFQ